MNRDRSRWVVRAALLSASLFLSLSISVHLCSALTPEEQDLRALYQRLIETDTTHSSGSTLAAAEVVERSLERLYVELGSA